MDQLHAMRLFLRIAEVKSFSAAATQLGLSAAAASRSIQLLESHLNVKLLNRTTRTISLTDAGVTYLDGCRTVVRTLEETESRLNQDVRMLHGLIRIGCVSTFANTHLCRLLSAYSEQREHVEFSVTACDDNVELLDGGFDLAFVDGRRAPSSTVICRTLVDFEEALVASPDYLARAGLPVTPSRMGMHKLIFVSDGSSRTWELTDGTEVFRIQSMRHTLRMSNDAMARLAALSGMGIAMLPIPLVHSDLKSGALTRVLSDYPIRNQDRNFSLVYPSRLQMTARTRSFIEFAVAFYRNELVKPSIGFAA